MMEDAKEIGGKIKAKTSEVMDEIKEEAGELLEDAKEVGAKIKDKVEHVAHDVKEKVEDFVDGDKEAKEKTNEAKDASSDESPSTDIEPETTDKSDPE